MRRVPYAIVFAPVYGAILFATLIVIYYWLLKPGEAEPNCFLFKDCIGDNRGKVLFGTSLVTLGLAMFWSIAVSLSIIRGEWDNLTPRQKRTLSAAVFIAILTCWALLYCRPLGGVSSNTVIKAIDATKGTWLAVDGIVLFQNFLASTAIVLLVVSLCILVFPLKNEEINRLSSRIHRFALSIYSTAALLAAGIFEIYTLFMWAAARPEFHGNVNQIRSLANTLTVAAGVFFSTLMLVIYTPVAIV